MGCLPPCPWVPKDHWVPGAGAKQSAGPGQGHLEPIFPEVRKARSGGPPPLGQAQPRPTPGSPSAVRVQMGTEVLGC